MMGQNEPDDKAKLLTAIRAQPAADLQAGQEPPAADAWLERRLRVFERALNALEVRAEASARDQARAVTQLEERLLALAAAAQTNPIPAPEQKVERKPVAEAARLLEEPEERAQDIPVAKTIPVSLALDPLPEPAVSREEMADVLQAARSKARPVEEPAPPKTGARMRWMAIGALSLVALFLCASLTLGDSARATSSEFQGDSTAYRRVAAQGLSRTIAVADSGDARAQAALALAYLRGAGVSGDPSSAARWSAAAAQGGNPMGQYLLGALYGQGEGVKTDPVRAFELFSAAAARGNLKAMHNLAIAYVEGNGTRKNETKAVEWFTRAAERGYVDSAFDMGVLYERGMGVKLDLTQALKWYAIAAKAGDPHSRERVEILREQIAPAEVRLAVNAAANFTPLAPLESANRLPAY
jgi:localization factor PodJL